MNLFQSEKTSVQVNSVPKLTVSLYLDMYLVSHLRLYHDIYIISVYFRIQLIGVISASLYLVFLVYIILYP